MPILDSPRWDTWPIPSLGPGLFAHCFLLRLDPAASVAALEDEEATRAASLVPRDWFLGVSLAHGGTTLYADNGVSFLNFKVVLAGVGLPDFPQASVPIAPTEQRTPDRPPLQFESALPWDNLYVHTHRYVRAIVSRVHYTDGQRIATLNPLQQGKLREHQMLDELDINTLILKRQANEQPPAPPVSSPNPPTASDCDLDRDAFSSTLSGLDFGSEISESEMKYYLREDMQIRFSKARLYVEAWLDPTALPELPTLADPAKFKEARSRVEEIWKAWQERMLDETLAKRPETNEWLRGVEQAESADEHVDSEDAFVFSPAVCPLRAKPFPHCRLRDSGIAIGDDEMLSPEDAVDVRMEHENSSTLDQSSRPMSSVSSFRSKRSFEDRREAAHVAVHALPVESKEPTEPTEILPPPATRASSFITGGGEDVPSVRLRVSGGSTFDSLPQPKIEKPAMRKRPLAFALCVSFRQMTIHILCGLRKARN